MLPITCHRTLAAFATNTVFECDRTAAVENVPNDKEASNANASTARESNLIDTQLAMQEASNTSASTAHVSNLNDTRLTMSSNQKH